MQSEIDEDLCADSIVSQIGLESQFEVGFDRITSLVLQSVRFDLVEQPDTAPLLLV